MLHFPRLNAPLLPLAVCLAAGIAIGGSSIAGIPVVGIFVGVVVLSLLVGRWPLIQSMGVWLCFLVLGMLIAPQEEERPHRYVHTETVVSPDDEGFNDLSHWQRLKVRALQWRGQLVTKFHTLEGDEEAEAVLAAMVLGDKSALTRELRTTYSVSGASHILALSGLHLSIIYLLLTRLTLGRRRFWLVQVLVILAIWAFALLTGLSTSIVRAAIMLTAYSLFSLGGRRHAPLGVLSFTAILMLLIDPHSLFDVGFQLSFMAMLGILLFDPLFENMVSVKWMMSHRPVKYLYELVGVSISAQLGTAPLVAFYFGRFSTWFLLTNLIVVPLATLILYAALTSFVIPALGSVALWLAGTMNAALGWVQALPLSSIEGLHPSLLQVAMIYVIIAVLYLISYMRFSVPSYKNRLCL